MKNLENLASLESVLGDSHTKRIGVTNSGQTVLDIGLSWFLSATSFYFYYQCPFLKGLEAWELLAPDSCISRGLNTINILPVRRT